MQYVDRRNALSLMRLIHQHHVPVYDKVMLSGVLPSISIWLRIALCELLPRHSNTLRELPTVCLLYTSPSPRDLSTSRMPSSA